MRKPVSIFSLTVIAVVILLTSGTQQIKAQAPSDAELIKQAALDYIEGQ